MRVCIVGGIFGKPPGYRAKHSISPETVLADGLAARGIDVCVAGHQEPVQADCDVVHVHHFGCAALRMAVGRTRQRFIFTPHDPFLMNGLPVPLKRRLADPIVLRRADRVVALTEKERGFLETRCGIARARIAVIPNGIDSSAFHAAEGRQRDAETLLFVGQLRKFKGLDYLLPVLAMVRRRHPNLRLIAVYQNDHGLARYLDVAARCGVAGCVDFAGAKAAHELRELYQTATMVVVPSLGECLSTVVSEAMLCGAPVVATDTGGIREQLDAETGVIVPVRDVDALACAIIHLLEHAEIRANMGAAAHDKAAGRFTVQAMIDKHLDVYAAALRQEKVIA
ncbi:MAG: glycosyltransferase family 4 protein, partial [Acidobacteria bacterium]|nr:glycosyltransferase family 4 protein [Acidobacteriota bacterium]